MSIVFAFLLLIVQCITSEYNATCSKRDTACPNNGICDPNSYQCVPQKETIECGGYGDFLNCGPTGTVWGECGSGKGADCQSTSVCPDKKEGYEAIDCNYPGLLPNNGADGWNVTHWLCGADGQDLSCYDDSGSVMVGVCGSGQDEDCKEHCTGFHGILCAKSEYFNIDFTRCDWEQAGAGEWAYCPPGTVATGHCGSGKHANCGRKEWHAIQCCNFVYS